jgi:AcrR family transcriptional regulator
MPAGSGDGLASVGCFDDVFEAAFDDREPGGHLAGPAHEFAVAGFSMTEKGYVATSVADVLRRSGGSRQSFYQVFDSKLDCFMAAFDVARDLLMQRLLEMVGADEHGVPSREVAGDPLQRFEWAFRSARHRPALYAAVPGRGIRGWACGHPAPERPANRHHRRVRRPDEGHR